MARRLAAGERRLQHVAGVHGAFGRARADQSVQLVDEEDDFAVGVFDLLEQRLEAVFEFAADTSRRRSCWRGRARRRACPCRISGTSPWMMRRARPSTMAVFPTPGSPIRTGLFFVRRESTWTTRRISSSRPMTGSSLPLRARSVRSFAVFFERLELAPRGSGRSRAGCRARSESAFRTASWVAPMAASASRVRARPSGLGQREQQVLGGDVVVLEVLGLFAGAVEHLGQGVRHAGLLARRPRPWAASRWRR